MLEPKFFRFDTLSLHAGQQPDPTTGARAVPIYQTTSYVFRDADHAAALFNLERGGHIYSRISNPTVAVLEERLAALEGGVGAVCTASGQAAMHLAICTLMGQGGHIVASRNIYGGSYNILVHTLPRFGITTTFVDPRDHAAIKAAIKPETRLVFGEILPRGWYDEPYRLMDWWIYGLPMPPPGYDWVRVGYDAVQIDSWNGRVVQVVRMLFW